MTRAARRELRGQTVWHVNPGHDTLQGAYNRASAGDVLELKAGGRTVRVIVASMRASLRIVRRRICSERSA